MEHFFVKSIKRNQFGRSEFGPTGFLTGREDELFREGVRECYRSFVENMMLTTAEEGIFGLQTTITSGFLWDVALQ